MGILALVLLSGVLGAAALPASVAARGGPILSPLTGERLPAKPTEIKVRVGRRAKVDAWLNGRDVGECICPARRGIRKLKVSASHGLRHGRNILRVKVRRPGTRKVRRERVRFRVARTRPLSAAGKNRRVGLHAQLLLDGTRSRLHPRARRANSRTRYRWRVVRAPAGSELATGRQRRGRNARSRGPVENLGRPGRLGRKRSATPVFRPDMPGVYRLRLKVRANDGKSGGDGVTLRVDPDPLLPINTMAKPQGQSAFGVRVGNHFYPDPGDSQKWLQVVTLKPDSLKLLSNKSYDCPEANSGLVRPTSYVQRCVDELSQDLDALKAANPGPSPVIIAVNQPPDAGPIEHTGPWELQPPVGAREILYKIGLPVDVPWRNTNHPLLRGRFSAIGRFGGPATRHENTDLADLRDTGEIRGYLLEDNQGYYTSFESGEMFAFDTQAPGSDTNTSVMQIGSRTYSQPVGRPPDGGFHVLYIERQGLRITDTYYETGGDLNELDVARLRLDLSDALERGQLVFIQSRGDSRVNEFNAGHNSNDAKGVVDLLNEDFGATRNRAYRALDLALAPTDWSYRLIAQAGTRPGRGMEAEGPSANGLNGVPATGYVTRSSVDYGFEVESSQTRGEVGGPGASLREVALSEPGDWPEKGDAGRTAAIAYAGGTIGLDSRRTLYWSQPYTIDFWAPKVAKLQGLACPDKPAGFTCADFAWARQGLIDEIGWLESAHAYVKTLAEPFARNQLSSWADVANVASAVSQKVQTPPTDKTLLEVGLAFELAGEVAEEIPVAGSAFAAFNDSVKIALEWARIDDMGTEATESFEVSAADAGRELVRRLQAINDTLQVQLVNVIASDYRKLRTVGLCGGLDPACPDPPLDKWNYTSVEQRRAAPVVHDGVEAMLYASLMPVQYRAWAPPLSPYRSFNWSGHQPAGQTILGWECPFHNLPETAQLAIPLTRKLGDPGWVEDQWRVLGYAYRTGAGIVGDPRVMHLPDASVTDYLFKPQSEGGLGLFPESFYYQSFGAPGKTLPFSSPGITVHEYGYPLGDSEVRWILKDDPPGIKQSSCGY